MKHSIPLLIISAFLLIGCSTTKKVEIPTNDYTKVVVPYQLLKEEPNPKMNFTEKTTDKDVVNFIVKQHLIIKSLNYKIGSTKKYLEEHNKNVDKINGTDQKKTKPNTK